MKDWETTNPLVLLKRALTGSSPARAAEFAADTADAIADFRTGTAFVPDAFYVRIDHSAGPEEAGLPVVPLVSNISVPPIEGVPVVRSRVPTGQGHVGPDT